MKFTYRDLMEQNEAKKTKIVYISLLLLFVVGVLVFILLYRWLRFKPILEPVNGEYITTEDGEYTVGAFQKEFPSLGGNLCVNHTIAVDGLTGETLSFDYCDLDLYPKLFKGYEIQAHVCYAVYDEDGNRSIRHLSMELDEEMNYLGGDYGSEEAYITYFSAIQKAFRIAEDVWGIVTTKESLN